MDDDLIELIEYLKGEVDADAEEAPACRVCGRVGREKVKMGGEEEQQQEGEEWWLDAKTEELAFTDDIEDVFAFALDSDGVRTLATLVRREGGYASLLSIGFRPEYVREKIEHGFHFFLLLASPDPPLSLTLADWEGVASCVRSGYGEEVWARMAPHWPLVTSLPYAVIMDSVFPSDVMKGLRLGGRGGEGYVGVDFLLGGEGGGGGGEGWGWGWDAWVAAMERGGFGEEDLGERVSEEEVETSRMAAEASGIGVAHVRAFLFLEMGLRELYLGTGRVYAPGSEGGVGSPEYLIRNHRRSHVPSLAVVPLRVEVPE